MAEIGDVNANGLKLIRKTIEKGNHRFARIWIVECSACHSEHRINSCDFHIRRCPKCQDGMDSL
jgi:hypothetical protein